jgi:signal transduction histidine kinase/CheY-like chemotaxis protein
VAGCLLVALALAAGFTALATAGQKALPAIMQGQHYTPAMIFVVSSVWAASLVALIALWRLRERSMIDLWLMVVMVAWLADIALSAVLNAGRFDLGFYAGRIYGLLAASFVLMVLLLENGTLYGQLAQAHARERQKSADLERVNHKLESVNAMLDEFNHRLQQASRFKSEFLANMTHELRTPLNAIIGFSELLKDGRAGPLEDKQRRFAGLIFEGGEHLLALINDVLDLAKVEAGRMTLDSEPVDLGPFARSCLAMFDALALRRGLRLQYQGLAAGRVTADARKLRQIVFNLLSNAVKFTPDGGTVTLSLSRLPSGKRRLELPGMAARVLPLPPGSDGELLEICVRDSGPGLPANELSHLFEPFSQLSTARTTQAAGTGLGLALVSRLAELHGGAAGVASAPGQGAVFGVWIPWRTAAADEARTAVSARPAAASARRALVIEDDPSAAELLRAHLESAGFEVHWIDDASRIEQASQPVPDVITLDIRLPGSSGWDVLEQLKQHPVLAGVPVVIVSVVGDEHKGVALGAAKVLQKPLTRQALLDAVHAVGNSGTAASPRKVLVIDDDPRALELVASSLGDAGCEVQRASDGAAAIRAAQAQRPDLIILDLLMPGLSGFEVVEAVRRDAATASVPIVVMTAKTVTAEDRERLNGHVRQVMSKTSFDPDRFLSELNRALHDSPLH